MAVSHTRDWRLGYIVCEHVAADDDLPNVVQPGRVPLACCHPCEERGWLHSELEFRRDKHRGFVVARMVDERDQVEDVADA